MIVYHFNFYLDGGAALAARHIHESLEAENVTSRYFHSPYALGTVDDSYRKFQIPKNLTHTQKFLDRFNGKYAFRKNFQNQLDHYLLNKPFWYTHFSYSRLPYETPLILDREKPDIIHLHWISGLFDYPSFFHSIPDEIPIVWTLQDMNPFTGGCHHAQDCERYINDCGNCPQLNENRSSTDLSYQNWHIKRDSLSNKRIHVIACCKWLEERARKSGLFSQTKSIATIPNSVDFERFFPRSRTSCREALQIPKDAFVIAFGAQSIDNPAKGLPGLLEAADKLSASKPLLLLFGSGDRKKLSSAINMDHLFLGPVVTEEMLSLIYSAADVFVLPSFYESMPLVILESLSCETPVVAFDTGGVPEVIRPFKNGLLAQHMNYSDLCEKLLWMYQHPEERRQMGKTGRSIVEKEFSLKLQTKRHRELYESILN